MKIALFCSSSDRLAEYHLDVARSFGKYLAENNHDLIYGGASSGLMEVVAQTCTSNPEYSGKIIGVLPDFLTGGDRVSACITDEVKVSDLAERKKVMIDMADAFVTLPGGFGTLDELFEVLAYKQVTGSQKPVWILDPDGFYVDLLAQVERMIDEKFLSREGKGFHVIETIDEMEEAI